MTWEAILSLAKIGITVLGSWLHRLLNALLGLDARAIGWGGTGLGVKEGEMEPLLIALDFVREELGEGEREGEREEVLLA
jgi:hypothetical protein